MNRLPIEKRAAILGMLVEGCSLRSTSRLADVSINTVSKLQVDVGDASTAYQDRTLRGLHLRRIQVDDARAAASLSDPSIGSQTTKMLRSVSG